MQLSYKMPEMDRGLAPRPGADQCHSLLASTFIQKELPASQEQGSVTELDGWEPSGGKERQGGFTEATLVGRWQVPLTSGVTKQKETESQAGR